MTYIPYDTPRCEGYQADGEWREGCVDCLRRTTPGNAYRQAYIEPPRIIAFECEYRIEPLEAP